MYSDHSPIVSLLRIQPRYAQAWVRRIAFAVPLALWIFSAHLVFAATYQIPNGKSLSTIPKLSPGDRVELQRGGVWHEVLQLTSSGVSGNPIVYTDYGTGPKPIIDLGASISTDGWTETSAGSQRWSKSFPYWPGRMWFNGVEYGCPGFAVDGNGNALGSSYVYDYGSNQTSAQYRWWWNSGVLYIYSDGNPASTYSSIEIAEASSGVSNSWSGKSYVTFKNLEFRRGSVCISLSNCDYFTFDSCKVLAGTSCYGLFITGGSDYGVIQNHCTFDREDTVLHQFGYGGGPTLGGGDDNIAIQFGSHWDIGNSYFGGTNHAGVEISGDYQPNGNRSSNYNKIHDCELYGGSDYCRAFLCQGVNYANPGDSTMAWLCHHNEFYRNYIHGMTVVSDIGSIYNKVYYNIFADQGRVWWDDLRPGYAPGDQVWRSTMLGPPAGYPVYHLQVFNNTFYTAQGSAIRIATETGSHGYNSFKNNIIYDAGLVNVWASPYTALEIWPGVSKDTIQNNIIFSPHSTATICLYQQSWGPGWTPRSVAFMEANPGPNVISGNIATNPNLSTSYPYGPLGGSPAPGAGINVGLSADYQGNPVANPPAIGALEATSGPSLPSVPMLLLPGNRAVLKTPEAELVWIPATNASRHRIQVADDFFQTIKMDTVLAGGTSLIRFGPVVKAVGTYYWRVAGVNTDGQGSWASPRSFAYVPDTVTPPPVLPVPVSIAPSAGLAVAPGSIRFVWHSSGSGAAYRWQLANDSSFVSMVADTVLRDTSVVRLLAKQAVALWWRTGVRKSDSSYSFGEKRSLSVSILDPPTVLQAPLPVYPSEGLTVAPGTLRFVWHASGGGTTYRMQLARDSAFSRAVADTAFSDTTISLVLAPDPGVFWWRAGVRQADGLFSFGQRRSFTVIIASPSGTLMVDPDSLPAGGGTVHLTWNSANAQSAALDQEIGQVPLQGYRDVGIQASTTFILTLSGNGETRTYSASVRVANSVPARVLPLAPPSGALLRPPRVVLSWTRLSDALTYHVEAASDSLFKTLLVNDSTLTITARVLSSLSDGVTVFWRVRAKNSAGAGAFSETFRFTTLKTAVPAGSVSVSPENLPAGGGISHLVWNVVNTDSVRIDPGVGTVPATGSIEVEVTSSRLFTLNAGGTVLARAEVTVITGSPPATRDITSEGTPVAASASPLLAAINDGTMLPPGSTDTTEAYSSLSGGQAGGPVWVGYEFPARRTFAGLIFQEGPLSGDGGWFDTLVVQVRSGGTWRAVTKMQSVPEYGSLYGPSYETYILRFAAASGEAIRIFGTPGGDKRFVTVGELRVLTPETPLTQNVPPRDYGVDPNYPNPFNPSTRITYRLPAESPVRITVYNILGEEIARLVDGEMSAGVHTVEFSGRDLPAGVYFYFIRMGGFSNAGKMLLVR